MTDKTHSIRDRAAVLSQFNDDAQFIAKRLYQQPEDKDIYDIFRRVADGVFLYEPENLRETLSDQAFEMMANKRFCPGGRILAGIGTAHGNALNCFKQGATLEEPASLNGIMEVAYKLALVTKVGGGNGVNLDDYVPKNPDLQIPPVTGFALLHWSHSDIWDFLQVKMRRANDPEGEKIVHKLRAFDLGILFDKDKSEIPQDIIDYANKHHISFWKSGKHRPIVVPDSLHGIMAQASKMVSNAANGEPSIIIDLSKLRSEGSEIANSSGKSSGPVSFLIEIFDNFLHWCNLGADRSGPVAILRYVFAPVLRVIKQGGQRRGAGMATLSVNSPDIMDFITCKDLEREKEEGDISTFNISVLIPDDFMESAGQHNWDIMDAIATHAWKTGEPGILFVDRMNENSALKNIPRYYINTTNPCVTADTWVQTSEGARKVSSLIGEDFTAVVHGGHYSAAGGFWPTGVRPVYRVTTAKGYEVEVTDNHRFSKLVHSTRDSQQYCWTELRDLTVGDKIGLQDHRKQLYVESEADMGNFTAGYCLGFLIGDGYILSRKNGPAAFLDFYCAPKRAIGEVLIGILKDQGHEVSVNTQEKYDRMSLRSSYIDELAHQYGLSKGNKIITEAIEGGDYNFCRGLIQALFDSDGSVQGDTKKGISVRLGQSNLDTLKAVQRMLLRFGIISAIYQNRRKAGYQMMPNGKGGKKSYYCQANHDLIISGDNLFIFRQLINFSHPERSEALEQKLSSYQRLPNAANFYDTIASIQYIGEREVFDVTVDQVHCYDSNGISSHNCGEIPLTTGENCCLGSLNLAAYVYNGKHGADVDEETLERDVKLAVRFLDNVLDVNTYVLDDNREAGQGLRRIGLGVMGLADALVLLGYPYGSKDAVDFTGYIMEQISYIAVQESRRLAKEKGAYPVYKEFANERLYNEAAKVHYVGHSLPAIDHAPRRNVAVLTVPPTGSISMVFGVSSGIEPIFSPFVYRRIGSEYRTMISPLLLNLLEEYPAAPGFENENGGWDASKLVAGIDGNHGSLQGLDFIPEAIRDVFLCAHDVAPIDHVNMQAAVQRAFDSPVLEDAGNAVSKTVNLPNSATVADVKQIYQHAFDTRCKGVTVYRDGSRAFQVLSTSTAKPEENEGVSEVPAKEEIQEKVEPEYRVGDQVLPVQYLTPQPKAGKYAPQIHPRPERLQGFTDRVNAASSSTGKNHTFLVTVNGRGAEPLEVILTAGKAGDETNADSEALGRLVSTALQHGVDPQAIIKTLRGIHGGMLGGYNSNMVGSKADIIAIALESYLSDKSKPSFDVAGMLPFHWLGFEPKRETEMWKQATVNHDLEKAKPEFNLEELAHTEVCPSCGTKAMVREGGCSKCLACGFSRCS